jgi:hypothetical protein
MRDEKAFHRAAQPLIEVENSPVHMHEDHVLIENEGIQYDQPKYQE